MLSAAKVGVYEAQVKRIGLISCPKQVFLGLSQFSDDKKRSRSTLGRLPKQEHPLWMLLPAVLFKIAQYIS